MGKNDSVTAEKRVPKQDTGKDEVQTASVKREISLEDTHVDYTELALDCLDLKAQEELFSVSLSGMKREMC